MLKCRKVYRYVGMPMSETIELDRKSDPKAVKGYAFYDWGKSAFETSVTTAILPSWFAIIFLEANGLTTTIGSIERPVMLYGHIQFQLLHSWSHLSVHLLA